MEKLKLETLHVRGDARALGEGQGEHFRERIEQFVDMRFEAVRGYLAERGMRSSMGRLLEVGAEGLQMQARWDPEGHAEHVGIADAARIDRARLFTATNMTDNRDAVLLAAARGEPLTKKQAFAKDEGCSSLLVPADSTEEGVPFAGQTWDLNPPDVAFVVAIRRSPEEGPETWGVTCTGCLTLMGLNEHGLAVGTTNIKTYGSRPGVGYLSILHRAVRCGSVREASAIVREAPHAGAHTYWLADAEQQLEWEASPTGQHVRTTEEGPIFRTNHCLNDAHVAIEGEVVSESSRMRFARLGEHLAKKISHVGIQSVFSDRGDGSNSINRYEEDQQGTATNAVFIASPSERKAWACRGPADRGEWQELSFS